MSEAQELEAARREIRVLQDRIAAMDDKHLAALVKVALQERVIADLKARSGGDPGRPVPPDLYPLS